MQGGLSIGGLRQRDLNSAYLASLAGGPHIDLDPTREGFHVDGTALGTGTAGNNDGPDYFRITRGGVNVLNTRYNAVDLRALIYSSALNGFDIGPDPALLPNRSTITILPDALTFLREDRVFTVPLPPAGGRFRWLSDLTIDASVPLFSRSFGGFVSLNGRFIFDASANPFGMGNALLFGAVWKNGTGIAANFGPSFLFANNSVFEADNATITASQGRIFFDNSTYRGAGTGVGTMDATIGHVSMYCNLAVGSAWTLQLRRGLYFPDWIDPLGFGSGAIVTQVGIEIPAISKATSNIGMRSAIAASGTNFFLQGTGTARVDFGGILGLGAGATVDWEISRIAASLASLGADDSLRIPISLFMGAAGSVRLFEGAANRLDLATGDSFNMVSGDFTHTGTGFGIHGAGAVAQSPAYIIANVATDRVYDAGSTSTDEIADVLGTLIADLQAKGLIGS